MDGGYSLCVLCCCSFGNDVISGSTLCRDDIVKFFKILVACPPQLTTQQPCSKLVDEMPGVLDTSGLSVCRDCHAIVTVALEARSRAEHMEENVRRLQMKILEQLRALNSELDLFHQEMAKIENVVKTSDESCLMFHMPTTVNNSRGESGSPCDKDNNGVILLRERILEVVTDLRMYQVSYNDPDKFPVDEYEVEAMWEDAEQLVQCTPEISCDSYPVTLSNSNSSQDNNEFTDFYVDSTTVSNSDSTPMLEKGMIYMGHSVGTEFDLESESDTEGPRNCFIKSGNFREEVIQRAIAREATRTAELDNSTDPLRKYYLKYNSKEERLMVGHVEVKVDTESEVLNCSLCTIMGKRAKPSLSKQNWRDMEKGILVHIIGKHLEGFTCVQCGEVFKSHTMIKKHYANVHPRGTVPPTPLPPPPVPKASSGKTAKRSGAKQFKCSMCSSAFSFAGQLKKHFLAKHGTAQALPLAEPVPPTIVLPKSEPVKATKKRKRSKGNPAGPVVMGRGDKPIPQKSPARPHECHICKYAFTKGSHLKRHFEVHRKRKEMV